jgi:signal transduction histidine kinase
MRRELEELSARLVEVQEAERRRIARELHDQVGQSLSALLVELGNLKARAAGPPEAARHLDVIRSLAEESVRSVRDMALLLRPSMLDDLGLVPALEWQAREVSRRSGMRVTVAAGSVREADVPDEVKTCVYRLVQESLHNCVKHSQAKHVRVAVRQEQAGILLTVQDDGRGFDPRSERGLGLLGMEERVRHLGGALRIESEPEGGTVITASLRTAPAAGAPA